MTRDQIQAWLELRNVNVILADGLDEAFLGIDESGDEPRAVYSAEKCVDIFSRTMSREEADEFFWYNTASLYLGPQTPIFISTP